MRRALMALIVAVLAFAGVWAGQRTPAAEPPTIVALGRVIRLPIEYARGPASDPSRLAVWPGAEDELPEGPSSFDVLPDGRFAIADPLAGRVAIFTPAGEFSGAIATPFTPDGVLVANGELRARDASTDVWMAARASPAPPTPAQPLPTPALPSLTGINRAFVPGPAGEADGIAVTWAEPAMRLIAVERLAVGDDGSMTVALEVTPATLSGVTKIVRLYRRDGTVQSEIRDIPLDYFVAPRDELRVRGGWLYQLEPREREIRINAWPLAGQMEGRR